jgi:small-conductance mechanosensitive channel
MGIRLACMANATTATILGSIGPFLLFVVVAIPFAIGQVHRAVGHILRPPGTEADPEMGPTIMETLKMQGVEAFGDFAIQIRLKIMTRPGEQFVIRRKAMAMVRQTFQENGIEFAFPKVLVDGGGPA